MAQSQATLQVFYQPAMKMDQPAANAEQPATRESSRLMYGLSAGHAVKHFCQGSLLILLPSIRNTLGLSDVAVGGMFTAQQVFGGIQRCMHVTGCGGTSASPMEVEECLRELIEHP